MYNGSAWTQTQLMVTSDGATGDSFGESVAVYGGTIAAGAFLDDNSNGADAGTLLYGSIATCHALSLSSYSW